MIGVVIATLKLIYDYAMDHPDVVRNLADEARKILSGHADSTNQGAMHGLAAGLAAANSNAVQAAMRAHGIGDIDRARRIVHDWTVTTSTRNATLLQSPEIAEMCAELLRDLGRKR